MRNNGMLGRARLLRWAATLLCVFVSSLLIVPMVFGVAGPPSAEHDTPAPTRRLKPLVEAVPTSQLANEHLTSPGEEGEPSGHDSTTTLPHTQPRTSVPCSPTRFFFYGNRFGRHSNQLVSLMAALVLGRRLGPYRCRSTIY